RTPRPGTRGGHHAERVTRAGESGRDARRRPSSPAGPDTVAAGRPRRAPLVPRAAVEDSDESWQGGPMADRGAGVLSLPDDWPDHPDPLLALNRMGSFDWDLDTGVMQMDAQAREIFDMRPEEYDDRPGTLSDRVPPAEAQRLDAAVSQALK